MIQTDHDKDEDNNDADGNVTEHPRRSGREQAHPKRFEDYEVYVTLEEEEGFMLIGGPVEKLPFFQIAPGPILSNPIHSNSSQYDPCTVWLTKRTTSLPAVPPKFTFLCTSD
jgi:hypothetical protein